MTSDYIKNIVLLGASGNAGSSILNALLSTKRFDITVLSRSESQAKFPEGVKVVKGAYDDSSFLESAMKGADALIITLSVTSLNQESALIEAAARAGVQWIVPNEYTGDGENPGLLERVPVFAAKRNARELIMKLGCKYLAVATGPWTDWVSSGNVMVRTLELTELQSIRAGAFRIDAKNKTATLVSGTGRFNTSTLQQVGKGVAALLSLPIKDSQNPDHSLSHYANSFAYVSSLYITQSELFEAVKRATGTQDQDWTIEHDSISEGLKRVAPLLKSGDPASMFINIYYNYMGEGLGGDVEAKAAKDRKVLGLKEEDLDDVVRRALGV